MSPSVDPVLSVFKVSQNQRHSQPLTMLSRGVDLHEKWVSGQNGGEMPWVSCRGAKHAQGWPSEGKPFLILPLPFEIAFSTHVSRSMFLPGVPDQSPQLIISPRLHLACLGPCCHQLLDDWRLI